MLFPRRAAEIIAATPHKEDLTILSPLWLLPLLNKRQHGRQRLWCLYRISRKVFAGITTARVYGFNVNNQAYRLSALISRS